MSGTIASRAMMGLLLAPRRLAQQLTLAVPTPGQGRTYLALDGQWLKLLQVEGVGPARRVLKLFACPVEGLDPDALRKAFLQACDTEGVSPRETIVASPTHLSTIRLFTLPSTDQQEIRDIVDLQVEKHTPYAKEEILSDFTVLERDRSGYSRVLLFITHQDVVYRPVRLLESCAMPLDRVGSELEGLIGWYQLARRELGGPASGEGATVVMDVDAGTTTLMIMQRGQLQLHRSLAAGAEQLQSDPAHAGERLASEVQRSVEAGEAEGGGKLQDVLLTGRIERLEGLKTLLERQLGVPVTVVPACGSGALSEAARAMYDRAPDVSFAGLYGLAASPGTLDVTPPATRLRHAFEAKAKSLVVLGCQGMAALILACLLMISRAHREQRYYQQLRAAYTATAQQAAQLEGGLQEIGLVKERVRRRGELLEAVRALAAHSSDGVQWHGLTYVRGEQVTLKGSSEALPKIYEFVASLDGLPEFGKVETRRVAKRKSGEQDITDFEIVCPIAEEREPDAAAPAAAAPGTGGA